MSRTILWGILGTGTIAHKFAAALVHLSDSRLIAVGSRSIDSARAFAQRNGVPRHYGSYEDLVNDGDIDVIYVATPHSHHKEHCILCLEAQKAVLCEKPFTTTAEEARQVISVARRNDLFCMEAMWMRFNPLIHEVQDLIAKGAIGDLRLLRADVGYPRIVDESSRFFAPALGGGALLDLGVYPVSLAFLLLGEPQGLAGRASIGETGVDEQAAFILSYPKQLVSLSCSIRTHASNDAVIMGTHGSIQIHAPMYNPTSITLTRFTPTRGAGPPPNAERGLLERLRVPNRLRNRVGRIFSGNPKRIVRPLEGNGMNYEAEEVVRCLLRGERESRLMPLDESLRIMQTIDGIRSQWATVQPT